MYITKEINIGKNNTIIKVTENVPMERRTEKDHHKVGDKFFIDMAVKNKYK